MARTAPKAILSAAQAIKAQKAAQEGRESQKVPKILPTPEREAINPMRSAGLARCVIPPIETMRRREQITDEEYITLKHYSTQVAIAHQSPARSCCDRSIRGGSGNGPSAAVISAKIETARLENWSGPHVSLVRAVCRDDMSLTQWCIQKHGGRERTRDGKTEIRPVGKGNVAQALEELKDAAKRMKG
jgi:hypothetical protein